MLFERFRKYLDLSLPKEDHQFLKTPLDLIKRAFPTEKSWGDDQQFCTTRGEKLWSCSSEEIQICTHAKTTRCHIQGTKVDILHDLVASASFSPKPLAFTFIGDEPLAPAKTFMGILEGLEIWQIGVTQSQPEFPVIDTSRWWCPCTLRC